jgi:hypothetical protein
VLNLVDQSLEAFLRAEVPLPANQIDISFVAPDRDWAARTTKPTVSLYLWDVRVNLRERESGVEVFRDEDGTVRRQVPKPRMDLRYLVTAWTNDVRDEHQLLGSVLGALYSQRELPLDYLAKGYAEVRPVPAMTVAQPDARDSADFWSALGGRLKPGLDLIVTATLDVALAHEVGPPVLRYEVEIEDTEVEERVSTAVVVGDAETLAINRGGENAKSAAGKPKR